MSVPFREVDETIERDLFERRARAMGAADGVPSLEAVLRAAQEDASVAVPARPVRDESRERSGARARAWSGLALAAACVIAVMKNVPDAGAPSRIAADIGKDAGVAMSMAPAASAPHDEIETTECTGDHALASTMPASPSEPVTPVVATPVDGPTCDTPLATFESSATLSCDRDEANQSPLP